MPSAQRKFTAADLIPGTSYRVLKSFEDYGGFSHPVGKQWRYIDKSFLPYEDGLTLKIELEGQLTGIRLQWRDYAQTPSSRIFQTMCKKSKGTLCVPNKKCLT